jgi:poly [ADP-ribose] polymerase
MSATDKKYAKLVMVTGANNNKYYEMIYEGGSTFTINYGRIESTKTTLTKPINKWDSIYNEKVGKGYKDVTHTISVTVDKNTKADDDTALVQVKDAKVAKFLALMKQYTDGLVAKTYTVKAKDVTQAQVDEAQAHLDALPINSHNSFVSITSFTDVSLTKELCELMGNSVNIVDADGSFYLEQETDRSLIVETYERESMLIKQLDDICKQVRGWN